MAKLIEWIRRTSVQLLDPQRDERVREYACLVAKALKNQSRSFDFETSVAELEVQARDVPLIQERIYELALSQAWRDKHISEAERKGLDWVAKSVLLSSDKARQVELRLGLEVFQGVLAEAVTDGVIQPSEVQQLQQVASSIGQTVRELVTRYFSDWGEGFLRAMFVKMADDGKISQQEWDSLVMSAKALGLKEGELLDSIKKQGERFVEHVLLDAKADGRLSDQEKNTLDFLMDRLKLSPKFKGYVQAEVRDLKRLTDISMGKLPVLRLSDAGLRAGEIVHFEGKACYEEVKQLKSGPQLRQHEGRALITDCRLIFDAPTRTFDLNHRRVTGIRQRGSALELSTTARGGGRYQFGPESKLAFLIYDTAVRKANQTLVERLDGLPTRHIPREVRQRVYQKYGGCCAECGSNQYVEYDHIIPVAKGGSNSEQNVQILCRRCNLKKSDNI